MYTYFARHGSGLDIDTNTFNKLWTNNYIGIHYPWDIHGTFAKHDAKSLNPSDYKSQAKSCLKKLTELAKNGGYVFAVYDIDPGGKIGYVEPNSIIELLPGTWGQRGTHKGREAILKVIKLNKVKNLSASESISLKSVQPRQGTFCTWHMSGARVQSLLDGYSERREGVSNLTTDLQEVMCMEFLRTEAARKHGLPILQSTLSPVGRTMKDIDIHGITPDNKKIFAQVTNYGKEKSSLKIKKLDNYASPEHYTILFHKRDIQDVNIKADNRIYFPLDLVFHEFCEKNDYGIQWLKRVLYG